MRIAVALALALALVQPGSAHAAPNATLSPVGDLDGDGRADLASLDSGVFSVRSSRTGRVLWRRTFGLTLAIRPARVGPRGENGLVVERHRFDGGAQGTVSTYTRTFLAVDRHGRDLWSREYPWYQARTSYPVRGPEPRLAAIGQVVGNAADDLLVVAHTFTYRGGTLVWANRTVVLDGANGTEHPVGLGSAGAADMQSGTTLVGTGPIDPAPIGGRVVSGSVSEQGAAVVTATRPGEEQPDWVAAPRVSIYHGEVRSLGDVTGDRTPEVVLLPVNDFKPMQLAVLDGADGRIVYAGPGVVAFRQRAGEVTVASMSSAPGVVTLTWTTFDGAGATRRQVRTSVRVASDPARVTASVTPLGDVQRDGYADAAVDLRVTAPSGTTEVGHAVVDGRTGRVLWWPQRPVAALGDDVVDVDGTAPGRLRVVRRDGRSGRAIWVAAVPFRGYAGHDTRFASLDGDRVLDLLVHPFSTSRIGTVALSGATGRVLARAGAVG